MIDLRHLSHLITACECENLTRASEDLKIAPSTLSASLKALETELGFPLFKRFGSGLYPRSSARWLFRAGLPLLLLERHIRRRVRIDAEAEPHVLKVFVDLKFTIGRVSKAILRAIALTEAEEPLIMVHPVWIDDEPTPFDREWADELGLNSAGSLTLRMIGPGAEPDHHEIALLRDLWVLACRAAGDSEVPLDLSERTIMVPALSQGHFDAVDAHLAGTQTKRVRLLPDHPGSLPRLMNEYPDSAFLLPSSMLAGRLGLINLATTPVEPALITTLVARLDGEGPITARFLERLRLTLSEPEQTTAFTPELTTRRVRYYNLAHRLRSVSAAARVANVAQPALSEQVRKLEATLGIRVFDRQNHGVAPTSESRCFAQAAAILENGLHELSIGAMSSLSASETRLSLGVLPSVSQHGLLVNKIAEAVLALRRQHPNARVIVQEAPNGTLQDWVARGRVGIAIVETGPPNLPRLPLGSSEDLAMIAHPRHALMPPGPVPFAELARLPLALPTSQFGLRQLVDATAQSQRVNLKPMLEIDALAMLIAMLRHEPIATILPPSAVRRELDAGELCAYPIINPSVARRLYVIYSGDRSLTEDEREFVGLLRSALTEVKIENDGRQLDLPGHRPAERFVAAVH
jgi:LysR family transcriptional regulator, nitrogen assimilation regulatory protein